MNDELRDALDNFYKDQTEAQVEPAPENPGGSLIGWTKPMLSDAYKVHQSQIPEAIARDKKHGLNIEYTSDGRPKIKSQAELRHMMRSFGHHQKNGGYSSGGR